MANNNKNLEGIYVGDIVLCNVQNAWWPSKILNIFKNSTIESELIDPFPKSNDSKPQCHCVSFDHISTVSTKNIYKKALFLNKLDAKGQAQGKSDKNLKKRLQESINKAKKIMDQHIPDNLELRPGYTVFFWDPRLVCSNPNAAVRSIIVEIYNKSDRAKHFGSPLSLSNGPPLSSVSSVQLVHPFKINVQKRIEEYKLVVGKDERIMTSQEQFSLNLFETQKSIAQENPRFKKYLVDYSIGVSKRPEIIQLKTKSKQTISNENESFDPKFSPDSSDDFSSDDSFSKSIKSPKQLSEPFTPPPTSSQSSQKRRHTPIVQRRNAFRTARLNLSPSLSSQESQNNRNQTPTKRKKSKKNEKGIFSVSDSEDESVFEIIHTPSIGPISKSSIKSHNTGPLKKLGKKAKPLFKSSSAPSRFKTVLSDSEE